MPMVFPSSPTVGQVFSSGGRSWVWTGSTWDSPSSATAALSGLTLVKSQTIGTAVTSITVTDVFSATYDNYVIFMAGGSTSGGANLRFQLSGITSSVYNAYGYYGSFGSGAVTGYGAPGSTAWQDFVPTTPANTLYSFEARLYSPFLSQRKFGKVSALSGGAIHDFNLICDSTISATGFTMFPASGTMTGGTISVYGYRKA